MPAELKLIEPKLPHYLQTTISDLGLSDIFFNMEHTQVRDLYAAAYKHKEAVDYAAIEQALFADAMDLVLMIGQPDDRSLAQALVTDYLRRQ